MKKINFSALQLIVSTLIIGVVGFVWGSSRMMNQMEQGKFRTRNKWYVSLALFYQESVLSLPILILVILLIYSLTTIDTLLVLLAISFLLPTIFMEKILQRNKLSIAAIDILTVRFFERSSYILFAFGCIIGILFAVQRVGLIGR